LSEQLEIPTYVDNHDALVRVLGYWPSFHDSPLFSLNYSADVGTLEMLLQVFEYTSQTDERGVFILDKHHVVSLNFSGVTEADIARLDVPNRLFEILFSPVADCLASRRFTVTVNSVMGPPLDGRFSAAAGAVTSVEPCDESGRKV
jgi:hypothetical protein